MAQSIGRCHVRAWLLVLSVAAGTADLANAQATGFALFDGQCVADCPPPRIVEVDLDRGTVMAVIPLPCRGLDLDITADGRYLTWLETCSQGYPYAVSRWLMDRSTGQRVSLGSGAIVGMRSHPSEVRFLFFEGAALISLTSAGRTSVPTPGCAAESLNLSLDGARLLQFCRGSGEFPVRTTATGAAVQNFSGALSVHVGGMTLDERGESLYWANNAGRDGVLTLVRYDVSTGLEAARHTVATGRVLSQAPLVERRSGRVFYRVDNVLTAVHPVTLQPLGAVSLSGVEPVTIAFHPSRALAYVLSRPARGSANKVLDIVDTGALRLVASIALQTPPDGLASFIVAPHPPAPAAPSVTVANHRVTVTWGPGPKSPAITQYDLEVAGAAGGPALLAIKVAGLAFVADNVPPGMFYLRVRARNYAGVSAASGEVALRVP